jgi:hypothetical protein
VDCGRNLTVETDLRGLGFGDSPQPLSEVFPGEDVGRGSPLQFESSPGSPYFSRTRTFRPLRAAKIADERPAGPAPLMRTSNFLVIVFSRIVALGRVFPTTEQDQKQERQPSDHRQTTRRRADLAALLVVIGLFVIDVGIT